MFTVKHVNVVFLVGAVKLSFESSLKLKDVEKDNKEVNEGEYEPSDCTARQSVAILIPHRNRERHLLYLLHHLHPFLQRQQLHYAIYVIQQVFVTFVHSGTLECLWNRHFWVILHKAVETSWLHT